MEEKNDEYFMRLALEEATSAYRASEVPVGAVIVCQGEVIARAHNQVEKDQDPTAHAELLCIRNAASIMGNWRLSGCVLYSTLEPCSMCAGAMILSRLKRVVWGAPDLRHGAHGSWIDLLNRPHPIHQIDVDQGVLAKECAECMRDFFKQRRLEKCGERII